MSNPAMRHTNRPPIATITLKLLPLLLLANCTLVPQLLFAQSNTANTANTAASTDDYRLGVGHYKQQRWTLAAEHLQAFLKTRPRGSQAASARLLLGVSLTHLKKYSEARTQFKQFVADFPKDPSYPDALFRIGECDYLLGKWSTASTSLQSYLRASPKHKLRDWGQFYLGDALVQQKQYSQAQTVYRRSLTEFPKGSLVNEVRFGLAVCCEQDNKSDEARRLYNQLAADKTSGHGDKSLSRLGSLEFDAKRFAEAATAWDRLANEFPKSPEVLAAQLNSGYARFQLGQFPEAIDRFQAARKRTDQAAVADYWRGISLKTLDKPDLAIKAFQQAQAGRPDSDLARDIQFQWADTEFRRRDYSAAATRFESVVAKWPKHAANDQSLLFATEAVLLSAESIADETARQKRLAHAQTLVDRFTREFPASSLANRHRLQAGRLKVARGGDANLKEAVTLFRSAMAQGQTEITRNRARYQLARVASQLGDDRLVLQSLGPFLKSIDDSNQPGEFDDALVLAASSFLVAKQLEPAAAAAQKYLKKHPRGSLAADALVVLAEASQLQDKNSVADLALTRLANNFRNKPIYAQTLRRMAESSYAAKHYKRSDRLFGQLIALGQDSPFHAAGLSGRGWSLFESERYAEAAEMFGRVVSLYPKHDLAAESAYKAAESHEKAKTLGKAAEAYRLVARDYRTSEFAFLAARRAARLLAMDNKIPEAHNAYDSLLKQFPKADDRDELMYEWAGMHADAGQFQKADTLYKQLITQHPRSPLVTNARFSLAESDLVAGRLTQAQNAFLDISRSGKGGDEIQQDSLFRLVGIASQNKAWQQVREYGQKLRTRFPKSRHGWETRFQLGQAALHLKDYSKAKTELTAVLAQKADTNVAGALWFDETWILLAEAHFQLKGYDDVTRTVADIKRQRPRSKVLYKANEILGRSLMKQPRPDFDQARAAFARVIASAEGRKTRTAASCHLRMAETFLLQKNYQEARKQFLAVQILYNYPEIQAAALFQAAGCQGQLKEYRQAVNSLELLLKEYPRSRFTNMAKMKLPRLRQLANK